MAESRSFINDHTDLPPMEGAAKEFATRRHGNARRRHGLAIHHVHEVVGNLKQACVQDTKTLCTAWLHDTIEDTNTDYDDIKDRFGADVADCVAALSKDKRLARRQRDTTYEAQLRVAPWRAKVVKLADILANLQHIPTNSDSTKYTQKAEKLQRYALAISNGITPDIVPDIALVQTRLDMLLMAHGLEMVSLHQTPQ